MIRARHLCLLAAAGTVLAATLASAQDRDRRRSSSTPVVPAPAATPAPAQGFAAFQLVIERNIFNPNRVGRTREASDVKAVRTDEISLVGTMQYDKGLLAFFDSPDSRYAKALREGDKLADFKIQRIMADRVELLRDDKPVTLKLSEQLRRPEGADWSVRPAPNNALAPTPEVVLPSAPEASSAETNEVLKRLLQKREKQLK
jgi:hypothetical protein